MVREADAPASLRQDFREARLAFSEREAGQVGAIEFEQVESEIVDGVGRSFERILKRLEVRAAIGIEDDRLAVDQRAVHLELRGRLRSEEHTSELQSLMRTSYAVFCLKKK